MDDDVRDIFEVEKQVPDTVPQPLTKDAILHPQKVNLCCSPCITMVRRLCAFSTV